MAHQLDKKFLKDNSVDGTKIKLLKDQAIRAEKQNGDEVELLKLNALDKVLLDGKEVSYKSELDAEIAARISADSLESSARIAADEALDLKIEQEKLRAMGAESAIESALESEIERAIEQETLLGQEISNETSRALLAEQQISLRVDQTVASIETERLRAIAEELRIEGKVDAQRVYVDATFIAKTEKGSANGVVPLNAQSKIDSIYLPSFIDDVVEFESLLAFPSLGEQGKIYVAIDTSKVYRWSGSMYIEISPSEVVSVNGKSGVVTLAASDILTSASTSVEDALASIDMSIETERTERIAADLAEFNRATAEEARLDALIQTKADQSYVDQKIQEEAAFRLAADQAETAARILADQNEYARATAEELRIETRALAAEAALSLEIESIGSKFKKESFTIAQSHITAGFITLQFKAFENSTVVSVERLMLLEDVDYTVSVVGGVTRLTFIGSILQGQPEALSINDLIRVQYFKDLRA